MRHRHRLSKLLLRHDIVYSGGRPWDGLHEALLRRQQFNQCGVQLASDTNLRNGVRFDYTYAARACRLYGDGVVVLMNGLMSTEGATCNCPGSQHA